MRKGWLWQKDGMVNIVLLFPGIKPAEISDELQARLDRDELSLYERGKLAVVLTSIPWPVPIEDEVAVIDEAWRLTRKTGWAAGKKWET